MDSPMDMSLRGRELALERRAIKEGWPITDEMKKRLVSSAYEDAIDQEQKTSNRLAATRNLLAMEAQNIERERIQAASQGPVRGDTVIEVAYVKDWFHEPSEDQIRELEKTRKIEKDHG